MKAYYLVAYGHTSRWSQKVATPAEAMRDCYGLVAKDRMPYVKTTRKPCYLTNKEKDALKKELDRLIASMIHREQQKEKQRELLSREDLG